MKCKHSLSNCSHPQVLSNSDPRGDHCQWNGLISFIPDFQLFKANAFIYNHILFYFMKKWDKAFYTILKFPFSIKRYIMDLFICHFMKSAPSFLLAASQSINGCTIIYFINLLLVVIGVSSNLRLFQTVLQETSLCTFTALFLKHRCPQL